MTGCVVQKTFHNDIIKFVISFVTRIIRNLQFFCTQCRPMMADSYLLAYIPDLHVQCQITFGNYWLACIFRDLTGQEVEPLQKRIMCLSHEVVRFPVFKLGVLATFIYQGKTKKFLSSFTRLSQLHLLQSVLHVLSECAIKMSCLKQTQGEEWWPHGQCTQFKIEQSGFEP